MNARAKDVVATIERNHGLPPLTLEDRQRIRKLCDRDREYRRQRRLRELKARELFALLIVMGRVGKLRARNRATARPPARPISATRNNPSAG